MQDLESFRYAQFCPLARAAEILGQRWTLLILRELFVGPQRFSDLRRRLSGVSSSVLTERLNALEDSGVVRRAALPPPAATTVYELDQDGRDLWPALQALLRWGVRYLVRNGREPDDQVFAQWLPLAVSCLLREGETPDRAVALRARANGETTEVRVGGGPKGALVLAPDAHVDAILEGEIADLLGVMSGFIDPTDPEDARIRTTGDFDAARATPAFFAMDLALAEPETTTGAPADTRGMT